MGSSQRTLKVGDKVSYTIPEDLEREWEITSTFSVTDGVRACLSRPNPEHRLKVDRCNADVTKCSLIED